MKNNLIIFGHIIVIITIYLFSYILPGLLINPINIAEPIDFLKIIMQSLFAIIFFVVGSKLYVEKIMKLELYNLRVKFKKPDTFWIVVSVFVPLLVILFYFTTDRIFINHGKSDLYHTIRFFTHLFFISGICAGILEEVFFRGILMGYLEKKYSLVYAIIIPSLLFGAPHLLNIESFSIPIIIQVTVFITLYGVIMSLLVYYTNNIWNSISVHISWNIITGMIINHNVDINSNFILQMNSKSLLWNGGDYGLDVSIVGLLGFSIIGILIIFQKKIWQNN